MLISQSSAHHSHSSYMFILWLDLSGCWVIFPVSVAHLDELNSGISMHRSKDLSKPGATQPWKRGKSAKFLAPCVQRFQLIPWNEHLRYEHGCATKSLGEWWWCLNHYPSLPITTHHYPSLPITTHHYSRESVNLGFEQILDSVVSAPPGLLPSSGNGSPKAGQPHHPSFSIYTTQKCLCESGWTMVNYPILPYPYPIFLLFFGWILSHVVALGCWLDTASRFIAGLRARS